MTKHIVYPERGDEEITVQEAFWTAFRFLERYWKTEGHKLPDALLELLSGMQPSTEQEPMELYLWEEWVRAWEAGKQSGAEK